MRYLSEDLTNFKRYKFSKTNPSHHHRKSTFVAFNVAENDFHEIFGVEIGVFTVLEPSV